MWDWLNNTDNLKTVGTIGSALATGYSAYTQSETAKDALALQKSAYNRGIAKEDEAQDNFSSAINSSFGKKEKKDETTMDLGA